MLDTQAIKANVNLIDLVGRYVTLHKESSSEMSGPCPKCGGHDRLHVTAGWFFCRQCHERRGDAIEFVAWLNGLGFQAACGWLAGGATTTPSVKATPRPVVGDGPPPADWQAKARAILADAEAALWGDVGARARDWLHQRGLADDTLKVWRIGYCPGNGWYHDLFVPRGIVVPWLAGDVIWKLNTRRPAGERKYQAVRGSKSGLFGVDRLTGKADCTIAEGEFDTMLTWQIVGDLADALSLGSATGRLADRWLPCLLHVRRFWVATDADDEGDKAVAHWLELTGERGRRVLPPGGYKDITEAWQAGVDLRAWVMGAPVEAAGIGVGEPSLLCQVCGRPVGGHVLLLPTAGQPRATRTRRIQ